MSGLIERVESASGPSLVLDRDIALTQYEQARRLPGNDARISVWDGNGRTQITVKPYTASLDAAMTLVPEGCVWLRLGERTMTISRPDPNVKRWAKHFEATGATPALALCAAALKARGLDQ